MTDQTPLPPVVRATWVRCSRDRAFEVFTGRIGAWWPLPTHSIHGDRTGDVEFVDGHLVERSTAGEECLWGTVLAWEPPDRLVLTWHPGAEPSEASEVEVTFTEAGEGTRVVLEHRGWERFGETAMARRRRYVGPGAWGAVLEHFADVAEEPLDAVPGLDALESAYDAFLARAGQGPFGEPPEGEWGAAQVVAHVALNDRAMIAVSHAIVHRREGLRFENVLCQDRAVLAAEIARHGDHDALVAHARHTAAVAVTALSRLDAEQLATPVHCVLHHDGEVVLDQTMPWGQVAVAVQASHHLPAHVGQLAGLAADPGA